HTRSTRDWSSDVCSSDLDRYRGGGHGQRYPAVQRSRPAVADEVVTATRLSPANEPHSRVIHHTLATDACGVEQPLHVMSHHHERSEERRVGKEGSPRPAP